MRHMKGHASLRALLKDTANDDAAASVEDSFKNARLRMVNRRTVFDGLSEIIVVAGDADILFVDLSNDDMPRIALTGLTERDNHCTVLFKRPFRGAHCDVYLEDMEQDAHLGFMRRSDFTEVQTFLIGSGKRGCTRTRLEFTANDPDELAGIVWRGGRLHITGIGMTR